jgi:hypothetical protein
LNKTFCEHQIHLKKKKTLNRREVHMPNHKTELVAQDLLHCNFSESRKRLKKREKNKTAKMTAITLQASITNVTPIIRTNNILTSHNQTHKTPLELIKELYIIVGSSPSK